MPWFLELQKDYSYIASSIDQDCDLFLVETMASIREAVAAAKALSTFTSGRPKAIWLAFTVSDQDGLLLRSGEPLEQAVKALVRTVETHAPGGDASGSQGSEGKNYLEAILVNCSAPTAVTTAIRVLRYTAGARGLRFGAYANAFQSHSDTYCDRLTPEEYAKLALDWAEQGATIIGGCCGIFPEHIAAVNLRLKQGNLGSEPSAAKGMPLSKL
mmetsp:Transcript_5232/g.8378  ORF Transcript_5232/g.8378 Transcript_5232/m.8378 type:complete len:214 (+) Transcript_5232:801-1442(+)